MRLITLAVLCISLPAGAQNVAPPSDKSANPGERPVPAAAPAVAKKDRPTIEAAVARASKVILAHQEGEEGRKEEWPYEGVYRVNGQIPIGYRIGGTSICALALMRAPGFET